MVYVRATEWDLTGLSNEDLWCIIKSLQMMSAHFENKKESWGEAFQKRTIELEHSLHACYTGSYGEDIKCLCEQNEERMKKMEKKKR